MAGSSARSSCGRSPPSWEVNTADLGLLVLLISTLAAALAARRTGRSAGSGGFGRASALLVSVLAVAYVVTIWAMTAKPT